MNLLRTLVYLILIWGLFRLLSTRRVAGGAARGAQRGGPLQGADPAEFEILEDDDKAGQ